MPTFLCQAAGRSKRKATDLKAAYSQYLKDYFTEKKARGMPASMKDAAESWSSCDRRAQLIATRQGQQF